MVAPGETQPNNQPPIEIDTSDIDGIYGRLQQVTDESERREDAIDQEIQVLETKISELARENDARRQVLRDQQYDLRQELAETVCTRLQEISEDPFERTTDEAYWLSAISKYGSDEPEARNELFATLVALREQLAEASPENPMLLLTKPTPTGNDGWGASQGSQTRVAAVTSAPGGRLLQKPQ